MSLTVFSSYEESYYFPSDTVNQGKSQAVNKEQVLSIFPPCSLQENLTSQTLLKHECLPTNWWLICCKTTPQAAHEKSTMDREQSSGNPTAFNSVCSLRERGFLQSTKHQHSQWESKDNSIKPFCSEMPAACATAGSFLQDTLQILSFHTACFSHHKCSSARVTG